ncbi:Trp biosynthesis-associated membrane protein [Amycolatopsis cynarae]|uniref:Trp biosynthesis-associated membrane protein n=1 Tax=Amycolatopsis cynarae TaxID=2995223 RepID=A0ABY7B6N3_9PSEU|nr:Trp biosynthesis-associated membrane protein [Amycolatopsis sp. HUAS 11-8]WAL67323.1 Trp biosynthesis-associated membrane protein [Amycolatopsis sp. HUAS 11-8]
MSERRPLWTIIAALLLGAAALWGSSRLVWSASLRAAVIQGQVLETQTGAEHSGALVPLAVLAVAGVAGIVATGGWPRRLLGGVLALAGLAAGWIAVAGVRFGGFPGGTPVWQVFAGRGLALLGGILLLLGGLLATRRAGAMPRLGARYAAPGARKAAREPGTDLWEALSEGKDPTDR